MLSNLCDRIADFRVRAEDRTWRAMVKMAEMRLLGARSSTSAPFPPSHVLLEIITKCNFRCQWCRLSEKEYREAHEAKMPLEAILKILPQFAGVKVLMLYGLGEPLLHDGLEEIVREARKYVPCVCFTTNGTLMTEQRARSLARAGLSRIHLSLDSLDAGFFKKVTGGGDLDHVLNNVETFSRSTGLPVRIWAVVCRENVEQLPTLVSLKERIPTFDFLHFQMASGSDLLDKHNYSSSIPAAEMAAFKARIKRMCADRDITTDVGLLPEHPLVFPRTGICTAPWTGTVMINVKGWLTPCCILRSNEMANVFEVGFREAWNGAAMKGFRSNILAGRYIPDCYKWCGYKSV